MSTPSGPGPTDPDHEPDTLAADELPEAETEVFAAPGPAEPDPDPDSAVPPALAGQRRFTAPSGFDAGSTQIIDRPPDPATEIIDMGGAAENDSAKFAAPQSIPPRERGTKRAGRAMRGRWGWAVAIVLVIAALAAIAILATVLLTRGDRTAGAEAGVRSTIDSFDAAVQRGDLAALRSITCGTTADVYHTFDDRQWADTYARATAATPYPVVSAVDKIVVNGDHAQADVTSYTAFETDTGSSTRSFDLEFHDQQWKICRAPGN
jgi:hypothetical protein